MGRPRKTPTPPTLAEYVEAALANPMQPPAPKPKNPNQKAGVWSQFKTKEERSEYAKLLRSRVNPDNLKHTGRKPGVPNGWKAGDYKEAVAVANRDAEAAFAHFAEGGSLPLPFSGEVPSPEELVKYATLTLIKLVRMPAPASIHLAAARTLVEFTQPKPPKVSKAKVTGGEAEQWLRDCGLL
jgi:hypothetical protein